MIKFFNIRNGQTLEADTDEKIAALWSTSDRSPNVSQGQDMGWRLHPTIVVEMKKLRATPGKIKDIASDINKLPEEVQEYDILGWLSRMYDAQNAPAADQSDYQDEYDQMIRDLSMQEIEKAKAEMVAMATPQAVSHVVTPTDMATLPTDQLEALLEARYAAEAAMTTTTTTAVETTSTTTKKA